MNKLIIIILFIPILAFGQTGKVHIGNASDNVNAILQIDSDSKGILLPRLSSVERNSINLPAEGLLVYDKDTHGFWFYSGTEWGEIFIPNSDNIDFIASNDAKLQVEEANLDDDMIHFKFPNNTMVMSSGQFRLFDNTQFTLSKELEHGINYYSNEPSQNNSLRVGEHETDELRGENSFAVGEKLGVVSENGFAIGASVPSIISVSGDQATSFGDRNTVTDENGFVSGVFSDCSGLYATTWGAHSETNGNGAVAWGGQAKAMAANATAWGYETNANGLISTAFGNGSIADGVGSMAWNEGEASGNYSFCWGKDTKAYSENEICFGFGSEIYTPTGTDSDKLFVIAGHESGISAPHNVFQIFKNNAAMYKGEMAIRINQPGLAILGLKEETNGLLYGFEFQYGFASEKLFLRSKTFAGNDAVRMTFDQEDRVGLGRSATTNILEINGDASKSVAGPWVSNSDRRLKKNIQKMNSHEMLAKVLQMKPVSYEWDDNGKTSYDRPGGIQYGFIAQDLQKVWPEKVSKDGLGYLQTAYGDYDPFFVGAFKAQQKMIEEMQQTNNEISTAENELKAENEKLLSELAQMEEIILAVKAKFEK